MHILITNDDGIHAPGLAALVDAARAFGQVHVAAPGMPRSACGHAISVLTPLTVERVNVRGRFEGWAVDGSPADCVKLAVFELLEQRPDFVLSGINAGVNTAINVLYSGTVAAALEGALCGAVSIAFSLELSEQMDFERAGRIARRVFQHVAERKPPGGTCLNVNIPATDGDWPLGIRVCPQSLVPMADRYHRAEDPRGKSVYWLDGEMPTEEPGADTDLGALHRRRVTITPLQFDLTDRSRLDELRAWDWPRAID